MRVLYHQEKMDKQTRNLFIADLLGYKIQKDADATRKLKKLSEDKGFMKKIVDSALKSSSSTAMTVETVLEGIKTALNVDIFSFKVNGLDLFKLVDEKIGDDAFELEIFLNPLYLSSEIALKHAVMPGFRKPQITEEYMNERMDKAGKAWLFGFEKNIKEYIDFSAVQRTIVEK